MWHSHNVVSFQMAMILYEKLCLELPDLKSSGLGSECMLASWDPKGGELYCSTAKPWETVVEAGRCSDVQIV